MGMQCSLPLLPTPFCCRLSKYRNFRLLIKIAVNQREKKKIRASATRAMAAKGLTLLFRKRSDSSE